MRALRRALLLAGLVALASCSGKTRLPHEGKSVAELQRMLEDADPAVQAQGALGLSQHGAEAGAAVERLAELLASPDAVVRQHAALALGKIGSEARAAVPALIKGLSDGEWAVRRQTA